MSLTKGVTARVTHLCEGCHWVPSLRGTHTILPGHRYLLHTAFPGDEYIDVEAPFSIRECASCAIRRDRSTPTSYGICGSYCHGTEPCVLPFQPGGAGHEHKHVCWTCMNERQVLTQTDVIGLEAFSDA